VEWCLAGGKALAIEARSDRAGNIRANAAAFGVADRLTVIEGHAPAGLEKLVTPNAVFVGGGGDQALFDALWTIIPRGTRLVANAVTLETEVLLLLEQKRRGGELMRIELSQAALLGNMRGWVSARPLLQWSVVR
jgi:precorrin-6Y C5,15-methyltransferase (decarboxylating)